LSPYAGDEASDQQSDHFSDETWINVDQYRTRALIDAHAGIEALKTRDHLWYLGVDAYEGEGPLFVKDLSSTVIRDDVFERLTAFLNTIITGHQGFFDAGGVATNR
jgi:hypothetical protein